MDDERYKMTKTIEILNNLEFFNTSIVDNVLMFSCAYVISHIYYESKFFLNFINCFQ